MTKKDVLILVAFPVLLNMLVVNTAFILLAPPIWRELLITAHLLSGGYTLRIYKRICRQLSARTRLTCVWTFWLTPLIVIPVGLPLLAATWLKRSGEYLRAPIT